MQIRTILVPMDLSPLSTMAFDHAVGLAEKFSAKLHLLHAYAAGIPASPEDPLPLHGNLLHEERSAAHAQLEQLRTRLSGCGVACEVHLAGARAVAAIVDTAEAVGADLIVMGTHGYCGIKRILLGSVAEQTARLASCPILTIRARPPAARGCKGTGDAPASQATREPHNLVAERFAAGRRRRERERRVHRAKKPSRADDVRKATRGSLARRGARCPRPPAPGVRGLPRPSGSSDREDQARSRRLELLPQGSRPAGHEPLPKDHAQLPAQSESTRS